MQELALFSSQTPKLVGALEFGEGGFTSSNATHLLLIASVGNTLQCYRAVQMENKFDVLKVAEQEHEEHIHDGKFIGNNLLVFITTKAAYLANVDEKLEKIVAIDWGKFAYMEFFNEELNLNYDTKLIPRNVLNSVGKA